MKRDTNQAFWRVNVVATKADTASENSNSQDLLTRNPTQIASSDPMMNFMPQVVRAEQYTSFALLLQSLNSAVHCLTTKSTALLRAL